ncbi:MAG TPA: hypothetical protein VGA93_02180 [Actinomycetota bacterium]
MERSGSRGGAFTYWAGAFVLIGFGLVAIFSVGAPFLLTGLAMLIVGPWRHRPAILWPVLVGVWAFVLGYGLIAPLGCSTTPGPDAVTVCTHVFGIRWYGGDPGLQPAILAGVVAGAIGASVTRFLLARRRLA